MFIQIFLQESLDFYYFAVDVYVPEAGWNLTLHLGLYPRVRYLPPLLLLLLLLSKLAPVTVQLRGELMCLLKLAHLNENASLINTVKSR